MQLTTTTGTKVEVPVTLPDCFTFYAYLSALGGVHAFVCWPDDRTTPEKSEPSRIVFAAWAGPGPEPYVSLDDMGKEDLQRHWHERARGRPGFIFLDRSDADAVSEAAADVLDYVRDNLHPLATNTTNAVILRSIADLRASESTVWEAWERIPKALSRECRVAPRRVDGPSSLSSASEALHVHVERLVEDAETWSREKAERLAQKANPHRCDTAPSGSEKQGIGECGACQTWR